MTTFFAHTRYALVYVLSSCQVEQTTTWSWLILDLEGWTELELRGSWSWFPSLPTRTPAPETRALWPQEDCDSVLTRCDGYMSVNLIILGEEVQERGLNLSAMRSGYMKQDPFIPSALSDVSLFPLHILDLFFIVLDFLINFFNIKKKTPFSLGFVFS